MKRFIVVSLVFVLVGCVTINEEMLRKVDIAPLQKPTAIVELKSGTLIQKFNGEGTNSGPLSGTTVINAAGKSMMARWMMKDIISDYDSPGALKKEPDYTVILSGERNEEGSILGAILCGATFFLIPTASTLSYDLNVEFINNHTKKHYNVKAKNAVTTWMQLFLLPIFPFAGIGAHNMLNDIADYSYDELLKQDAFSYPSQGIGIKKGD